MRRIDEALLEEQGVKTFPGASNLDNWTREEFLARYGNAFKEGFTTIAVGGYVHYVVRTIDDIRKAWEDAHGLSAVFVIPNDLWEKLRPQVTVASI